MIRNFFLVILLACASCSHYHFGSALPKEQRVIEVAQVTNLTSEPRLEALLRNSLAESIMHTPGIKLAKPNQAGGLLLETRIVEIDQQRSVRTELRDRPDRDGSGNSYQTVVFRVTIKIEYQAFKCGDNALCRAGKTTVMADFPSMADQETAREEAFREAMRRAASQIVAEVTEG